MNLRQLNDRIIFMSMYNDIVWEKKEIRKDVNTIHRQLHNMLVNFPRCHWSFSGLGSEKKWYVTYTDKPDGSWDRIAENMMMNFSDSGHNIFRAFSAFESGELRSKEHGKKSIHFNGSDEKHRVVSPHGNLLQISPVSNGSVTDLCRELSEDSRAPVKLEAPENLETMEIPTDPSVAGPSYPKTATGETWCKTMSADSNNCPMTRSYPNYALTLV